MIIRSEQMAEMERHGERAFEREMADHIREFASARAKFLEEECLKTVVQTGLSKARAHGFTCRGPLRLYLDLMCMFGSDFDTDPQHPWAAKVLNNSESGPEMQRATQLWDCALNGMNQIAGPSRDLLALGLERIAETPLHLFLPQDLESSILAALSRAYPEKAKLAGKEGLHLLFAKACAEARHLKLDMPDGIGLISLMMFAVGCGVIEDPFYHQKVERVLADVHVMDLRISKLHECALGIIGSFVEDIVGTRAVAQSE